MLNETYPYYLANRPEAPNHDLEVTDKFTGDVATRVPLADVAAIDAAIAKAVEASHETSTGRTARGTASMSAGS